MKITPDNAIDLSRLDRLAERAGLEHSPDRLEDASVGSELARSEIDRQHAALAQAGSGEMQLWAKATPGLLCGDETLRTALALEPDIIAAAELAVDRLMATLQ